MKVNQFPQDQINSEVFVEKNNLTPQKLYDLFLNCWSAETCAPRMRHRWSEKRPTTGQCSITAFIVQDLLGGDVYGVALGDGNYHCFNVVDGVAFDLTSGQFDHPLDYDEVVLQSREFHFQKEEKYQRYLFLKKQVLRHLEA